MPKIKKSKVHVKVGDLVKIILGSNKYKFGIIIKVNTNTGRIILNEFNFRSKLTNENEIRQFDTNHSNVRLSLEKKSFLLKTS